MSYNIAYWYIKYIPRKLASDKVLPDKTFSIVKSPKYDRYQRRFTPIFFIILNKKFAGVNTFSGAIKSEIILNQQLAQLATIITNNKPTIKQANYKKNTIFGIKIQETCNY